MINRLVAFLQGLVGTDTIDEIMSRAGGEQGADRVKVTLVDKMGSSRNLEDPGFDTFCRYNSYRVLARKMV